MNYPRTAQQISAVLTFPCSACFSSARRSHRVDRRSHSRWRDPGIIAAAAPLAATRLFHVR